MNHKKFFSVTVSLAVMGVLLAMEIILSRFLSINQWDLKIGFSFIPIVIVAYIYGAIPAAVIAALGDFLGAVLFPIGPYHPGFTATAFLTGAIFGLFLHKQYSIYKLVPSVLLVQFTGGLILNTIWISQLYGSPFFVVLPTRIVQCIVMSVVEILTISLLEKILLRRLKQMVMSLNVIKT